MKKIIATFVIIAITLCLCLSAFATSKYDSNNIQSIIRKNIESQNDDLHISAIVGVWNYPFIVFVGYTGDIDAVVSGASNRIFTRHGNPSNTYRAWDITEDNQIKKPVAYSLSECQKAFFEYVIDPRKVFSDSTIKVTETYLIDGSDEYEGICIYYKTNKGDYVLYCDCLNAEFKNNDLYLIPKDDFLNIAKDYFEYMKENGANGHVFGKTNGMNTVIDLSQFKFTENNKVAINTLMNTEIIAVVAVLLSGFTAVIVFFVFKKRKNSKF